MRKSGCNDLGLRIFYEKVVPMGEKNTFLGTEPIGKLMRGYAVPCIISLLVGALYNIVDQIFIANASYLGSFGNAANTVVFPLTVVALAIAVMVGDGCCAFVSMALGRDEPEKAKRSVGNAVVLIVAASVILTAIYLIFADSIIVMFGGTVNEETFQCSQEYFFYISCYDAELITEMAKQSGFAESYGRSLFMQTWPSGQSALWKSTASGPRLRGSG